MSNQANKEKVSTPVRRSIKQFNIYMEKPRKVTEKRLNSARLLQEQLTKHERAQSPGARRNKKKKLPL